PALAVRGVAHELERILDRLRAADVEMHAAIVAELRLRVARDQRGELDLLAMQVLARDLRQPVDLALERVVEATVGIAEIDRRVPHLQVEIFAAGDVVEERAVAAIEDLRLLGVVNGVAVRAVERLEAHELGLVVAGGLGRRGPARGEPKRWAT